jgi:hypothetical protein
MSRSLPSLALVTLLTIGGALSGFLSASLATLANQTGGLVFPGLLFGLLLAGYLWFGANMRSAGVVTAIVSESWAALLLAVGSPIIVGDSIGLLDILNLDGAFDPSSRVLGVLTLAGFVGAAVVSLGFCALLQPRAPVWRIALEGAFCAAVGAWLAGRAPASALALTDRFVDTQTLTIVLWQTGMASVLGFVHMFRGKLERP